MAGIETVVGKDVCLAQCAYWQELLDRTYVSCMYKASKMHFLSVVSSGGCIVLNVLIVGATQLHIPEMVVTIFVIIASIIKAFQLQFKFELCGYELDSCKARLRESKVVVMELSNEATFLGNVDKDTFKLVRHRVSQALDQVPTYISVLPGKKREFPNMGGLLNRKSAPVDEQPVGTDIEAPAAPIPSVAPVASHAMAPPPDTMGSMADCEAPAAPKPAVALEAIHGMVPPAGAAAVAGDVASAAKGQAAAAAGAAKEQAAGVFNKIQTASLENMVTVLGKAEPVLTRANMVVGLVVQGTTALELTLNSLVMLFTNIPALAPLLDLVAIFASVNAIQKGIMMKLDFDVKRKTLDQAARQIASLFCVVKQTLMELDAGGELDSDVFDALKADFRRLVEKYASYLK